MMLVLVLARLVDGARAVVDDGDALPRFLSATTGFLFPAAIAKSWYESFGALDWLDQFFCRWPNDSCF